jgi:hypothetical protein
MQINKITFPQLKLGKGRRKMNLKTRRRVSLALGLIIIGMAVPLLKADSGETEIVFIPSNMLFPLLPTLVVVGGAAEPQIDYSIISKGSVAYGEIVILRLSERD